MTAPALRVNGCPSAERSSVELVTPGIARPVDRPAAERAALDLLVALGADPTSEGLRETPRRVASTYAELLTPHPFKLTTFPNDDRYDELVLARDIPFQSLCMTLRGVQKPAARTLTSALHGLVRDDPRTRQEFLSVTSTGGVR